jgi:hypothetical protein
MRRVQTCALIGALGAASLVAAVPAAASNPKPNNAISVVIDSSGSFAGRQIQAIAQVGTFMSGLEAQQEGVRHWQAADRISVIALDSVPAVVFRGKVAELATMKEADWAKRFAARKSLGGCTDLPRAFDLAAGELAAGATPQTKKYLFAFSDLISEPPTRDPNTCAPSVAVPGQNFNWKQLSDVSFSAFWLPPGQVLAWDRALRSNGLTAFRLSSDSESRIEAVDIPKAAKRVVTDEEKGKAQANLIGTIKGLGIAVGAVLSLMVATITWQACRRPRRQRATPTGRAGSRLVRGPVPPMRLPQAGPETGS